MHTHVQKHKLTHIKLLNVRKKLQHDIEDCFILIFNIFHSCEIDVGGIDLAD